MKKCSENVLFNFLEIFFELSEICKFKKFSRRVEIFITFFKGNFSTIMIPPFTHFQKKQNCSPPPIKHHSTSSPLKAISLNVKQSMAAIFTTFRTSDKGTVRSVENSRGCSLTTPDEVSNAIYDVHPINAWFSSNSVARF